MVQRLKNENWGLESFLSILETKIQNLLEEPHPESLRSLAQPPLLFVELFLSPFLQWC